MKWIYTMALLLLVLAGCQSRKKQEPVEALLSGKVGPSLPVNQSIKIHPISPTANSTLTIASSSVKIKNVVWYIDGRQSAVGKVLRGVFRKGDSITASVSYTSDGGGSGKLALSKVIVKDSPPVITSLTVNPLYPTVASTMRVTAHASDADGDNIVLKYQWYVNGNIVKNQTGNSFSCSSYKHGDMIHIAVTPFDGEKDGMSRSNYISIQNTPPVIISKPPSAMTTPIFSYKVKAVDIDNDSLTYKLKSSPKGMTISEDGLISWKPEANKSLVKAAVRIVVNDGHGGKAYQTFNINFKKKKS